MRQQVSKGSFKEVDIREVCATVRDAGINVISNYIFGLEHDTHETMRQTLDLALELNTEMANMYPCQALPGSPMHTRAKAEGPSAAGQLRGLCVPLLRRPAAAERASDLSRNPALPRRGLAQLFHQSRLSGAGRSANSAPRNGSNVEDMASIQLRRRLLEEPGAQAVNS